MSIILIGDVHGKTTTYQKMIRRMPPGQRTIQLGDMGIGFKGVGLHEMPPEHRWFRGNHDWPEKCRRNRNYLGDYGYIAEDRLFWLAGAWSIDREFRIEGQSWWADEELSYEELNKAISLYEKAKPDFVISHEAPAKAAKILLCGMLGPYFKAKAECSMSRTSEALQQMFDIHQPKEWVFGHYHIDKSFMFHETKFTCVAELSTYELRTDETSVHEQRPSIILPHD